MQIVRHVLSISCLVVSSLLPTAAQVTVKSSATVKMGGTVQLIAPVTGGNGGALIWKVNGKVGGSSTTGTISPTGLFVAPQTVSSSLTVTIMAIVQGTTASSTTFLTVEPCARVSTGLVSWWPGERTGRDVYGTNPGKVTGGVSFVPGEVALGLKLDGSTGYVDIPDSNSLDSLQQAVSVEMWAFPTPLAQGEGAAYLYARRDPLYSENFSVYILADGTLGVLLRTTSSPTHSGSKFESAPGAVTFGRLQHIAAVADTNSSSVTAYVNGTSLPLTVMYGPSSFSGTLWPVSHLYLGRREDLSVGEGAPGAAYFPGILDEVTLYSTALSQTQIQSIVNAGLNGKCR